MIKKSITSLAAVAGIVFALGVSQAGAVTIPQFDSATRDQQIEYLTVQTVMLKKYYESQGMDAKAACMDHLMSLRDTSTEGSVSDLFDLILDEIDLARDRQENHQVEDIIFGVVEYECSKPENQIAVDQEAPRPQQPG